MKTNDKWKNGTVVRIWGCEDHTNGLVGKVVSWSSVLQPDGSRKEFYGVEMPSQEMVVSLTMMLSILKRDSLNV